MAPTRALPTTNLRIDTLTITDNERAAIKAEARAYIAAKLRENLKQFEAYLIALLQRHGEDEPNE